MSVALHHKFDVTYAVSSYSYPSNGQKGFKGTEKNQRLPDVRVPTPNNIKKYQDGLDTNQQPSTQPIRARLYACSLVYCSRIYILPC